jgi:UDP-N-acetylmuramoyl-tripeptide--D-alanyl-D-alanine ligase
MTQLTTGFVAQVMRARGYDVRQGPDVPVSGGDADSRRIQPGQLFAAYPGDNTDGNRFVEAAFARGAVAAICSEAPATAWPDRTIVVAPDTTKAAGELGAAWRAECPGPRVVGITGTVGKTTCKEMTAGVLAQHFSTHKSEGGLNSRQGLPLALLSLEPQHEVSVLEMGMDSRGEIAELCEMARPEIGVVLNIGLTHVEKLGSIEAIAEEKLSLPRWLPSTGTAVLNLDDARIAPVARELTCRVLSFGQGPEKHFASYSDVHSQGLAGTRFFLSTAAKRARVDSPIPGVHTVPGVVAAMCVAMALGINLFDAANSVRKSGVTGRVRTVPGHNGSTLIDDRYNSSPASLAGALQMLGRLSGGRRIALLGKMAELGEFEEAEHRTAGAIAAANCDILFAVGEVCRPLAEAAREAGLTETRWFADKDAAAAALRPLLRPGDSVLLKASRSQEFETLIPMLEAKE